MLLFYYFRFMIKELFKNYDELLFGDGLQSENEEFYLGGIKLDQGDGLKTYYCDDGGLFLTIDKFWISRSRDYARKLFRDTEEKLEALKKEELIAFVKKFKYHLEHIQEGFTTKKGDTIKLFFDQFNAIIPKLNSRFKLQFEILQIPFQDSLIHENQDVKELNTNTKNNVEKIKWLGQLNVLTTLFYDLLNGQDKGQPLIEASPKVLEEFICNNFVDSEGHELSKGTVESYLKRSKPEKRAKRGDRIELGNLKRK